MILYIDKNKQVSYIRHTNKKQTYVLFLDKKKRPIKQCWRIERWSFQNKQNTRFRMIWDSSKSMWHAADALRKVIITYSILKIKRFFNRFYLILSVSAHNSSLLQLNREFICIGLSPSGKAQHFDCCSRWFESS